MKKLLVLTICFIFIGAIYSFAEPVQRHAREFGAEISHREYKEPGVMEQKGIMYGLFGSYTYRNSYMLRAEGLYSFGQVDYVIEPFIRYWKIADSKITTDPGGTSWKEPKNTTKEFGIKFAAKF